MYRRNGRKRKRRSFRRGYDRTGGFYGRSRKRRRTNGYGRVEKKFYDITADEPTIATGGQFVDVASAGPSILSNTLVDIPQGTGESERIGRKCTITALRARLNFEFLVATSTSTGQANSAHDTIRLMIIWDKQCNGTQAVNLDVLETNDYNSYRNLSNIKRFHMLHDRIYVWNTTAVAAGDGTTNDSERVVRDYQVKVNKKLFIPIEYDGTTGALTEIKSNNILILIMSKHGGRMRLADSKIRLRFLDY